MEYLDIFCKIDIDIIERMINIGFTYHKSNETEIGQIRELKYYPSYLNGNHYTLLLFKHNHSETADHRLYIHNEFGRYVDSRYQINSYDEWGRNYINRMVSSIFTQKIRDIKLKELIFV